MQPITAERESKYFYLFLAYVFILPLWPNYAELKFGGLPNIAPDRILRSALFFGFIGIFFTNSEAVQRMKQRIARHWMLVSVLTLFYVVRILSAWVSPNTTFQLYAFFRNEFLISFPFFFYALLAIRDGKSVEKIMVALVVAGFIASLVALLDYYKQRNLFVGIVPVTSDYLMGVFLDKTRDESYRAQGTFEHPIMLGQFYLLLLPIVWVLFKRSISIGLRFFYFLVGLLSLAAVYASGSRAALGLSALCLAMLCFWEIYAWTKTSKNRVLQFLVISQVPVPLVGALYAFSSLKTNLVGGTQEELSSTNSRIDMLIGGGAKVFESPIYGYGLGEYLQAFSLVGRAGIRTLDNFYLLTALEAGLLAPLLLLVFLISCVFLPKVSVSDGLLDSPRLKFCLAVGVAMYSVQMALHSLHQQFWMIMLFSVVLIVLMNLGWDSRKVVQ